jgi:hypothetical protein
MVWRISALEERFLVFEIKVDRAFGDAGLAGHVFELGRGETAVGEDFERGRNDFFRPGVFSAPPPGLRAFRNGSHEGQKLLTERSVSKGGSPCRLVSTIGSGGNKE